MADYRMMEEGYWPAMRKIRWIVECDGEREVYRTRAAARRRAKQWSNHPSNKSIRNHGPYLNADGIVHILRRETIVRDQPMQTAPASEGVRS